MIILTVEDKELKFDPSTDGYNQYCNELMPHNKVAPNHNFLMRSVHKDSKKDLKALLELPGVAMQLGDALSQTFAPALQVTVGKPKR
ncbi:MAG: putative phage tail assembly chaperone [Desulfovibrio sp.]